MSAIVPAILPYTHADLDEKLRKVASFASCVQIDAVDGRYAVPATWPYTDAVPLAALDAHPEAGTLRIEADLMVENALADAAFWISLGANRLVLHIDSAKNPGALLDQFADTYGHDKGFAPGLLALGVAIEMQTPFENIDPLLSRIDFVQFMGIDKDGTQGQPFDPAVVERIRTFKKAHPSMQVQVDGGVSLENAPALLSAGATRLIVGSHIWNAPDPSGAFAELSALTEEYGLYTEA